jgi:hypothetical protein
MSRKLVRILLLAALSMSYVLDGHKCHMDLQHMLRGKATFCMCHRSCLDTISVSLAENNTSKMKVKWNIVAFHNAACAN